MPTPTQITNSILQDVKQTVGQEFDDDTFDIDIMMHINTVFFTLNQLNVGPIDGFEIKDESTLWSDYTNGVKNLNAVKSYIYLRVRLLFDPPTNSFLVTSLEKQQEQLEWRLAVDQDPAIPRSELGEIND